MPGMEDTNGIEMDIATCALLNQVAKRCKRCKSLKFIVVIHCASLYEDRGGALRGVLKFAKKFVADFSAHKQSFMFLFSHSNEIEELSGPRETAKKKLMKRIIMIMEGSKREEDLYAVLNYIRGSLKRDNQRADIFYPSMDFSAVTSCVEEKMTKFTELSFAKSCNLTISSKLKLESAVQKLVHNLNGCLRGSCPDLCQVKDAINRLDYLERLLRSTVYASQYVHRSREGEKYRRGTYSVHKNIDQTSFFERYGPRIWVQFRKYTCYIRIASAIESTQ
jgi:hypothetical protein